MPLIRKDAAPAPKVEPGDLASPDADTRWSAARRLAKDPSGVTALAAALALENDARVRDALFTSLAHFQTPEAAAAIIPFIRSADAAVRAGALDALNLMPEAVAGYLPALLADPDPDVRLLVCDVVRRLPSAQATGFLCALLERETEANVCGAAVEALSEVGDETALPVLAQCAQRFAAEPFLLFSLQTVSKRLAGIGQAPP